MSVVSSVLSRVSTRSSGWRINVRLSSLMDSIFAIGFGLGLRFVVDTVSHHDFKLTGTLVGLWEGVILLHFLKKMPKSSDPYIAFGVRLFIDFIFTESIARMVLVLIWTALGMVLADITPAIWEDVGLKRVWKSFRRDLYTIIRMIPTVAFFPPTRTVRFSPSREPSVIPEEATEVLSPSIGTTEPTPITNDDPLSSTAPRVLLKRRVPGYFPVDYSDTETDSSVRAEGFVPQRRTSRRLSVYPQIHDYDDSSASDLTASPNDLDETNLSSDATETGEPPSALPDASEIPEIEDEPLLVDIAAAVPVKPEEGELTPTQQRQPYMPPTPSDSAARWAVNREIQEPLPVRPPSEFLPQIPDFLEEPASEDWEKIQPADYSEEKPPTPPAKDRPVGIKIPDVPAVPPPVPPVVQQQQPPPQSTTPPDEEGWDTMESQILTRDNEVPSANTITNENTKRQSQPPPYEDYETHDDIYDDPPADTVTTNANDIPTGNLLDNDYDTGVPPAHQVSADTHDIPTLLPPVPNVDPSLNPWGDQQATTGLDDFAAQLERDVEAAQLKTKQEAEEVERKAAEVAKKRAEDEAEEAMQKKRAEEKAEREKKERDDQIARQKKREEDAAAEKLKREEEKKRLKEEAEKKKQEEIAQKKKDAEEARARREEAAAKKAEEKRLEQEAKEEAKRLQEEAKLKAKAEKKEAERVEAERKQAEKAKAEEDAKEAEKLKAEEAAREAEKAKEEADRVQKEREAEDAKKQAAQKQAEAEIQANVDAPGSEQDTQQNQEPGTEHEQANGQPTEDVPTQETEAAPVPEETTEDVKTPLARPNESEGDIPENLLSPAEPIQHIPFEVAESVSAVSVVSEAPPTSAVDRLERMLALRAQMVEVEANLQKLKDEGHEPDSAEVKQTEKILRKMNRQAERRYATGISYSQMLNDEKEADTISLFTLNDNKCEEKIAEKIEQLLDPASRSLYLNINMASGKTNRSVAQRQKGTITRLTQDYNLVEYCTDIGKKTVIIEVSEGRFADWVTGYRMLATRPKQPDSIWEY